jgi:hypothetical protein
MIAPLNSIRPRFAFQGSASQQVAESQLLSSRLGRGAGRKVPGYARPYTRRENLPPVRREVESLHSRDQAVAMRRKSSTALIAELHLGGLFRLQMSQD